MQPRRKGRFVTILDEIGGVNSMPNLSRSLLRRLGGRAPGCSGNSARDVVNYLSVVTPPQFGTTLTLRAPMCGTRDGGSAPHHATHPHNARAIFYLSRRDGIAFKIKHRGASSCAGWRYTRAGAFPKYAPSLCAMSYTVRAPIAQPSAFFRAHAYRRSPCTRCAYAIAGKLQAVHSARQYAGARPKA